MKITSIKKIILNNKLLILFFAILISCDSMGDSDQNSTESMPTPSPAPTVVPTTAPAPPLPSNPTPSPTSPPPNPTPTPTQTPALPTPSPAPPTPTPTQTPPTPSPSPMPTATPSPTATPTMPPTSPPGGPLNEFQAEVLDLVNEARAQARSCGNDFFPAAPPVSWDQRIENAAQVHSEDMARNENFSHTGTDGSNAGDRLLMQGYNWRTWGENILVGLDDAPDAIDGWLGSVDHCKIIMSPSFEEVGAGVAEGIFQGFTTSYWTLLFATER